MIATQLQLKIQGAIQQANIAVFKVTQVHHNDLMTEPQIPSADLDLRGTVCPMAFVRLRLFADSQPAGAIFTVLYENNKANGPLKRSAENLRYQITSEQDVEIDDTTLKLMTVEKPV